VKGDTEDEEGKAKQSKENKEQRTENREQITRKNDISHANNQHSGEVKFLDSKNDVDNAFNIHFDHRPKP
jgi:hypothetical protein